MWALPSAEEWKKLRVARNAIAHEYPEDHDLRASAINRFFDGAMQVNALYQFVSRYLLEHFPSVGNSCE
jgi:hypothetical protein